MEDQRIIYLQMIQDTINRMSTHSSIFKGFAATVVAGIIALDYQEINPQIVLLSFLLLVAFITLDIYYLSLERKYRFLFEKVRNKKHNIDFSMHIDIKTDEARKAKNSFFQCIKSPSIYLFYPILITALLASLLMNS